MANFPNYIHSGGSASFLIPSGWSAIVGVIGTGYANIYTIPSLLPTGTKVPYSDKPVIVIDPPIVDPPIEITVPFKIIGPDSTFLYPVSDKDVMAYIEAIGGVVEWAISPATPKLISYKPPQELDRGSSLSSPGDVTLNFPRGRSSIAAGKSTCTISNANMVTGVEGVFIQALSLDKTATQLMVTPGLNNFVVTANAPTTGVLDFEWAIF